jgi:hypothetical protein
MRPGPARLARAWIERLVLVQLVDRAVALAGLAFTALVPLLIVYDAVVPTIHGRDFAADLTDRFELEGAAAESLRQALASRAEVTSSFSVLGAVLVVFSALSFARALQRLYEVAFRLPALGGVRGTPSTVLWVALIPAAVTVGQVMDALFGGTLVIVADLAFATVVWTASPFILLGRRLPWRGGAHGGHHGARDVDPRRCDRDLDAARCRGVCRPLRAHRRRLRVRQLAGRRGFHHRRLGSGRCGHSRATRGVRPGAHRMEPPSPATVSTAVRRNATAVPGAGLPTAAVRAVIGFVGSARHPRLGPCGRLNVRGLPASAEPISADRLRAAFAGTPDDAEILVVAPALHRSALRFWLSDADEAIRSRRSRAHR